MNEEKYSYYTKFKIASEENLDDFWSFIIFRLNIQHDKMVYDRYSRLYNILLEHKFQVEDKVTLFIYETSNTFVIKLKTNITSIKERLISRLEHYQFPYRQEKNSIIYDISKIAIKTEEVLKTCDVKTKKELIVYMFIESDDRNELTNIIEKIEVRDYAQASLDFSMAELNDYKSAISYFASIIQNYGQLINLSNIVAEFSVVLSLYANECLERGSEVRAFLKSLIRSLDTWQEMLFAHGCESIDFMDASFAADLGQFKMMLNLYDDIEDENTSCSLDDIFDF